MPSTVLKFLCVLVLRMSKFLACDFHSNVEVTASANGKTGSFLASLHQLSENIIWMSITASLLCFIGYCIHSVHTHTHTDAEEFVLFFYTSNLCLM
jgi:hypothetical protein